MGDAMEADRAFIGQDVSVTPLIGKLRLHIQGYVGRIDFFISPLKHEDVILRAPWFDHLVASIEFPRRRISFKFKEKDMYINAEESGSTIPLVNDQAFDKSIKSSAFASNFLNTFQDVFIDDIPGDLPPKRGDDDHMIELLLGSSPPNKPPYRVSQAQQEEIMRQVNELVEKGMTVDKWEKARRCEATPRKCPSQVQLFLSVRERERRRRCRNVTDVIPSGRPFWACCVSRLSSSSPQLSCSLAFRLTGLPLSVIHLPRDPSHESDPQASLSVRHNPCGMPTHFIRATFLCKTFN
ncbi:hypothetical protein L7F22_021551 [Adiantum nelumboides]|nr:hypothetical protein [Adiantum nelumboides]